MRDIQFIVAQITIFLQQAGVNYSLTEVTSDDPSNIKLYSLYLNGDQIKIKFPSPYDSHYYSFYYSLPYSNEAVYKYVGSRSLYDDHIQIRLIAPQYGSYGFMTACTYRLYKDFNELLDDGNCTYKLNINMSELFSSNYRTDMIYLVNVMVDSFNYGLQNSIFRYIKNVDMLKNIFSVTTNNIIYSTSQNCENCDVWKLKYQKYNDKYNKVKKKLEKCKNNKK